MAPAGGQACLWNSEDLRKPGAFTSSKFPPAGAKTVLSYTWLTCWRRQQDCRDAVLRICLRVMRWMEQEFSMCIMSRLD